MLQQVKEYQRADPVGRDDRGKWEGMIDLLTSAGMVFSIVLRR
jgi:hypothetical protein